MLVSKLKKDLPVGFKPNLELNAAHCNWEIAVTCLSSCMMAYRKESMSFSIHWPTFLMRKRRQPDRCVGHGISDSDLKICDKDAKRNSNPSIKGSPRVGYGNGH